MSQTIFIFIGLLAIGAIMFVYTLVATKQKNK